MAFKEQNYIRGIYEDIKEDVKQERKRFNKFSRANIVVQILIKDGVRKEARILDSFMCPTQKDYLNVLTKIQNIYGFKFWVKREKPNQIIISEKDLGLNSLKNEIN